MPAAVYTLDGVSTSTDATAFIGRIQIDADAVVVVAEDDPRQCLPVLGRVHGIERLEDGGRVVAAPVRGGVIVTAGLSGPGGDDGVRRLPDGRLLVQAEQGVVLQAGRARIELQPDGRLLIQGREVEHRAEEALALQASLIEIN